MGYYPTELLRKACPYCETFMENRCHLSASLDDKTCLPSSHRERVNAKAVPVANKTRLAANAIRPAELFAMNQFIGPLSAVAPEEIGMTNRSRCLPRQA